MGSPSGRALDQDDMKSLLFLLLILFRIERVTNFVYFFLYGCWGPCVHALLHAAVSVVFLSQRSGAEPTGHITAAACRASLTGMSLERAVHFPTLPTHHRHH